MVQPRSRSVSTASSRIHFSARSSRHHSRTTVRTMAAATLAIRRVVSDLGDAPGDRTAEFPGHESFSARLQKPTPLIPTASSPPRVTFQIPGDAEKSGCVSWPRNKSWLADAATASAPATQVRHGVAKPGLADRETSAVAATGPMPAVPVRGGKHSGTRRRLRRNNSVPKVPAAEEVVNTPLVPAPAPQPSSGPKMFLRKRLQRSRSALRGDGEGEEDLAALKAGVPAGALPFSASPQSIPDTAGGMYKRHTGSSTVPVPLSQYGLHWSSDAIVLYTNSVRSELNDLVYLASGLRSTSARACLGLDPSKLRAELLDFEQWYQYFSYYAELVFKGFEDIIFPFVTNLLDQRDVMISRPRARSEAHGVSHKDSWVLSRADMYDRMEVAKDLLATTDNRILRFHRTAYLEQFGKDANIVTVLLKSIDDAVPAISGLLDELDRSIAPRLALCAMSGKRLWLLHSQFVELLCRRATPSLGWSGVVTLTHWLDRKSRSDYLSAVIRGPRRILVRRAQADNPHHMIVNGRRRRDAEEKKRRMLR